MTMLRNPTFEELAETFVDITAPAKNVTVQIRVDGKVLWINVDGVCVLRICQMPSLEINDERKINERI
jgi:hypothetical protein